MGKAIGYVIGALLVIAVAVAGAVAVVALSAIWGGYVVHVLWGWFIVPTFGAPALSIPAAIGVMLVLGAMKSAKYREADDEAGKTLAVSFIVPLLSLGAGYVVRMFL